jgi:hypothetical protein
MKSLGAFRSLAKALENLIKEISRKGKEIKEIGTIT